jgi:hypothetical protein
MTLSGLTSTPNNLLATPATFDGGSRDSLGGHGGTGADTQEFLTAALAEFANQEGNVSSLATPVGVQFVEYQEFQVGRGN